jgi:hypothetical protein
MESEPELTRWQTNKLSWDFNAFVQYALKVIAIVKVQENAENVPKRDLERK